MNNKDKNKNTSENLSDDEIDLMLTENAYDELQIEYLEAIAEELEQYNKYGDKILEYYNDNNIKEYNPIF